MDLTPIFAQPVAHRGLHNRGNGVIENSRSAFARAIQGGYGIECDLQLSGDGVPVVFHDPTLDRVAGQSGAVSTLSAGQLGRITLTGSSAGDCPQTFSAMLEQVGGAVPLVVELKHQSNDEAAQQLATAAVKAVADYEGPLVFKSFDPELIKHTRRAGFPGAIGIITQRYGDEYSKNRLNGWERFSLRHLLHRPSTKFDFISCDHRALRLPMVRFLRQGGMKVMTWTVRSYPEEDQARPHADQIVFEGFLPQRA